MKKTLLFCFVCLSVSTVINAQNSNANSKNPTESIYTAIKPVDSKPYVFSNQLELDKKQASKKAVVLSEIKANANNPAMLKTLRENLWRLENATILTEK